MFRVLYQALDEREVSYGRGTLQLVLSAEVAAKIAEDFQALGITATVNTV